MIGSVKCWACSLWFVKQFTFCETVRKNKNNGACKNLDAERNEHHNSFGIYKVSVNTCE